MSSYIWWLLGYDEEINIDGVIDEIIVDEKVKSARHETLREIEKIRERKLLKKIDEKIESEMKELDDKIDNMNLIKNTVKEFNTIPTPAPPNSPKINRRVIRRPTGLKIVPPLTLIERVKYDNMKRNRFIEELDKCSTPLI